MNGTTCPSTSLQLSTDVESMSEATKMQLSGVEVRWRVDDSCTRRRVTADVKQRIGHRFVLNIADTDELKNALICPNTESLRTDWDIPSSKLKK